MRSTPIDSGVPRSSNYTPVYRQPSQPVERTRPTPSYQPPVRIGGRDDAAMPGGGSTRYRANDTAVQPGQPRQAIGGPVGGRAVDARRAAPERTANETYRGGADVVNDRAGPVRQAPRGIDGSLADRYRRQMAKDLDTGRGNVKDAPVADSTRKGADGNAVAPIRHGVGDVKARGDVKVGVGDGRDGAAKTAPVSPPKASHRYPGTTPVKGEDRSIGGTVGGHVGGDQPIVRPSPVQPGHQPIQPVRPIRLDPPSPGHGGTPGNGGAIGVGTGRGVGVGSQNFHDWSRSGTGASVQCGVHLGWSFGCWNRFNCWPCTPLWGWSWCWYGSPFCASWGWGYYPYYSYCYSWWPRYACSTWWPTWCHAGWWSPWWWGYGTSYDFLYGYSSAASYDPPPSVVVVHETSREPAETVVVEGSREGAPIVREGPRASPEGLTERYVRLADDSFRAGRYQEASESYLRALGYSPNDGSLHFVLADALFALGDYHYAAFVIRKGIELEPDLARSDVDKRKFYGNEKDFEKHMAALKEYLGDHPYDTAAWVVLGYNQLFTRDMEGAERTFRKVTELDSDNAAGHRFLKSIEERRAGSQPATRRGS